MSLSCFVKMNLGHAATNHRAARHRRLFCAVGALAQQAAPADYTLDVAHYDLEVAPVTHLQAGRAVIIDVSNQSNNSEALDWRGLFLRRTSMVR
jgi:hypothetical protein